MLIKQIVETELQQLLPVEDQAKALYLDGKWPKLFQTNTVEDILRLRQQGEFPGQDVLPPIRLSSKASMFYSEFDIDIKRTLRYNLGASTRIPTMSCFTFPTVNAPRWSTVLP